MRHLINFAFGTLVLVLRWGILGTAKGAISGWIKSKTASGNHSEKTLNGHVSETHYPIHFICVHRTYFALGLYPIMTVDAYD